MLPSMIRLKLRLAYLLKVQGSPQYFLCSLNLNAEIEDCEQCQE